MDSLGDFASVRMTNGFLVVVMTRKSKNGRLKKNMNVSDMIVDDLEDLGNVGDYTSVERLDKSFQPDAVFMARSTVTSLDHHWTRPLLVSSSHTIDVWDHHRSVPVQSFSWGPDAFYCARFNPAEPDLIAASAGDNSVGLYDIRGNGALKKILLKMRCNAIAWNPMEPMNFTVANEDSNLYSFDMRKLNTPRCIYKDFTNAVLDVDYSPTGKEFVAASFDKTLRIFAVDKGSSRDVYHTKRMQAVLACRYTADTRFVLSGSADMCIRLWKSEASAPLLKRGFRERQAMAYRTALKEKYGHMKELRRISRHRHVPKLIKSLQQKKRMKFESQKRKEENRRRHSKPGSVPYVAERKKVVVNEIE